MGLSQLIQVSMKRSTIFEDLQQKLAPGNPTLTPMNSTYRGYGFGCCLPLCCASCFGWNSSRFAQSSWLAQFYTEFQHALWSKTRSLNLFGHWTAVLDPTSKGLQLFFKALGTVPADSSRIGPFCSCCFGDSLPVCYWIICGWYPSS